MRNGLRAFRREGGRNGPAPAAAPHPAAQRPGGGAGCQQDLQLDCTGLVCSELWRCKSSAVYAGFLWVGGGAGSWSTAVLMECALVAGGEA